MIEQQLELPLAGGCFTPCRTRIFSTEEASNDGAYGLNVSINRQRSSAPYIIDTGLLARNDQCYLQFNYLKADKTLFLAPNGEKAKHGWALKGEKGYLSESILDGFAVSPYAPVRLQRGKYKAALSFLLANALNAHRKEGQVLIETRTAHAASELKNPKRITTRTTNRLLEYSASINLIAVVAGKANEYQKASTWFIALPNLIRYIERCKIVLDSNTPHLELRDKDRKHIRFPKTRSVQQQVLKMERELKQYNNLLTEHIFQVSGVEFPPYVRRVFNYTSELGGRFYGAYSNYKKEERAKITIDGAGTVEQDFSSLHYNLLYSMTDTLLITDPYIVDGYSRSAIKSVSLRLLNSDNLSALERNITKSGNKSVIELVSRYRADLATYDQMKSAGLKATSPRKPKSLEGFIEGIPVGTKGEDLVVALLNRHQPISHILGTKNIGLKLQYFDSQIMASCIRRAVELNIPVLGVHDSIISKKKDKGVIYGIMRSVYQGATGAEIEVR